MGSKERDCGFLFIYVYEYISSLRSHLFYIVYVYIKEVNVNSRIAAKLVFGYAASFIVAYYIGMLADKVVDALFEARFARIISS